MKAHIAIVGEYDETVPAHAQTIPALEYSAEYIGVELQATWLPTTELACGSLDDFDGFWMAAGPAYKDFSASMSVLRHAREKRVPCLATCRGYQHMVLEYARNVVGLAMAEHQEYDAQAEMLAITKMPTGATARKRRIEIEPGSPLIPAYVRDSATEKFFGRYGVNPELEGPLGKAGFVSMASDYFGAYRVGGLPRHPFYIGSLFVPQMRATKHSPHPLITTLLKISTILRQFGLPRS